MSDTSKGEREEHPWDDVHLEEHPHDGEMPGDWNVQAERQDPLPDEDDE